MKKVFLFALLVVAVSACNEKGGTKGSESEGTDNDSIQALLDENEKLRNSQEELLATINEIEEGFQQINDIQGRITIDRQGETENARQRLREDMRKVQETMKQNAELIEKLQGHLRDYGKKNEQLQRTIDNMMAQMEQKNSELEQLRRELEAKDIHIAELDEELDRLNQINNDLQQQNEQQDQIISQQDRQSNTVWYCLGTKNQLKEYKILKDDHVLRDDFDKSFFTEIDKRTTTRITINYRKPELRTSHPAGSYTLTEVDKRQYILEITNPQLFWSTSPYLVVQIKD